MKTKGLMPFDSEAWLRSARVRALTPQAKGAYIDLLAVAWRHGSIPAHASELRTLLGLTSGRFRAIWDRIGQFWHEKPGEPGRLINERQEKERARLRAAAERTRKWRSDDVTHGVTRGVTSNGCDIHGDVT